MCQNREKDLSELSDMAQILMDGRLCISKTTGIVGFSWHAVVGTYQKWSKEGQTVNQRQRQEHPKLTDLWV